MRDYLPLLIIGGVIGVISIVLIIMYAAVKDKKQSMGFERHMKDGDIMKRLLAYAKPYAKNFIFVGFIMLLSIAYDVISPLIMAISPVCWRISLSCPFFISMSQSMRAS